MKGDTPQDAVDKKEVGRKIRALRMTRGLTQEKLAEEMNRMFGRKYTTNMISTYENGGDHMLMGILFDFAIFFGVAIQELLPARLLGGRDAVLRAFVELTPENQAFIEKMMRLMLKEDVSPA